MFNIIILGITSFLTDVSSEMIYPILPVFLVTTLGASPAILGLIEGIAESVASLLKVFSGFWSDKLKKRKPFAIFGYANSAAGKLFLFFSNSWTFVLFGRVIERFGKGVRTAPRDALIAEAASSATRGAAFGLHRSLDALGAVGGVTLAYFFVVYYKGNIRNIFLFSLVPAFLGVLFLFLVKEKKAAQEKSRPMIRFQWKALDKKLQFFLIFTFLFTLGNSSNQFLLLKAKDAGNSLTAVILFYLVYNISRVVFTYPASRLSDKIGRKKILVFGYVIYALVYLGFALNTSSLMFWVLFGVYGMYMGFTEGVEKALVTDISPEHLKATTIGLHATLVGIGLLPASLFAGLLWKYLSPAAPFYFGAMMGGISSVGLWFILKGL
jgi:MFS family permease